jgi:tetratricopeptide (TPR) repeat protein
MAGVFLSYDRDDTAVARIIATALEKAGHAVWWDLHVRGGAQFAKVIEEALKAADAVVVLWSGRSVESAWVRDEAAAGRDSGRLIPVTIDGTEAPLGFRQFQTIDLTDWKRGARSRGYRELEQTLAELGDASPVPQRPQLPTAAEPRLRRLAWLAAVPLLAVAAATAYLFWPSSSAAVPTVTVQPASNSATSQALSRDLLAKLGILQASNGSALQLVEEAATKPADLIFKVDAASDRPAKATMLLLSGRSRELLWSGDFDQSSGNSSDLKQQLAYSAANILDCASDVYGRTGRSIDEKTRRLYLKGCGDFSQGSNPDSVSLVGTFREITRRAPQFEAGWERLIEAEDEAIFTPPFTHDTPTARAAFKADIAAARNVNPSSAEAYIAEADVLAQEDFLRAVPLLELAAEKNPDDAGALGARSIALLNVGRLKDAVSDARRAVQMRPFSPRAQDVYVSALTYSGEFDIARQELAKAEALFPGASNLREARFRLNFRYGSAEEALKQLQRGEAPAVPGQDLFLEARINRTPANITKAVEAAYRRLDGSSLATADYIQTLAEFGKTQELMKFLLDWSRHHQRGRFVGVLFRPTFRDFWRDPRSMRIAAQFGLIGYWRNGDHWPDFCSESDLPYDCKKEAAKLGA